MTTFTDTWNATFESLPPDTGEAASQGAARIRALKKAIRERAEVDHSFAGDAHDGKHKQVTLRVAAGDPTLDAGDGAFYTKAVGGINEVFWKDSGSTVRQLTRNGRLEPFADATASTKRVKFDLSLITAGQERELKVPDHNITLGNWSTGDEKLTWKTVADTGWIMLNDGTIGNAASGATTRANADTVALFTLWWNNCADAQCPVSGGRGANAAADYAANKTLATPLSLGRALAIAGAGAGLTSRVLGLATGTETHTLITSEIPAHLHVQNAHSHGERIGDGTVGGVVSARIRGNVNTGGVFTLENGTSSVDGGELTTANATATNQNTGGGGAHANVQPSGFRNVMVKL